MSHIYLIIPKIGVGSHADPIRPDYLDGLGVGYACISDAESPSSPVGVMLVRVNVTQAQLDDLKSRQGVVEAGRTAQEVRQWLDSLSLTAERWLLALQAQREAMALRGVRNVPADPRNLIKTPTDELPALPLDLDAIKSEWRSLNSGALSKQQPNDLWKRFKGQWQLTDSDRQRLMQELGLRPATQIASETWTGDEGAAWPAQWVAPAIGTDLGFTIDTNDAVVDDATGEGKVGGTATGLGFAVIDAINQEDIEVKADATSNGGAAEVAIIGRVFQVTNPRDSYYYFRQDGTSQEIHRVDTGVDTRILNGVGGEDIATDHVNRFQVESDGLGGTDIRIRAWLDTEVEPGTWDNEVNDTAANMQSVSGEAGVGANLEVSTGRICYFDNLTMDDLAVAAGDVRRHLIAAYSRINA